MKLEINTSSTFPRWNNYRVVKALFFALVWFLVGFLCAGAAGGTDINLSGVVYVQNNAERGYGAGFVVGSRVITASHSTLYTDTLDILFYGRDKPDTGVVSRRVFAADTALVEVNLPDFVIPLELSKKETHIGDTVFLVGHPHHQQWLVFVGTILTDERPCVGYNNIALTGEKCIFVDITNGPGSSGGPFLNEVGQVVGMMLSAYNNGVAQMMPARRIREVLP